MNETLKFWIRMLFYCLILIALVGVWINAGGDPCTKCRLQLPSGDDLDCREMVEAYVKPIYERPNPINAILPTESIGED